MGPHGDSSPTVIRHLARSLPIPSHVFSVTRERGARSTLASAPDCGAARVARDARPTSGRRSGAGQWARSPGQRSAVLALLASVARQLH